MGEVGGGEEREVRKEMGERWIERSVILTLHY